MDPRPSRPAAGKATPDDWRRELFRLQKDQTTNPELKAMFGELFDELCKALADPNHPIHQDDNTRRIG